MKYKTPVTVRKTAIAAALAVATTPAMAQLVLEEVIVTAQKREQTLGDIPGSVAAVTQETLQKTVTTNFNDLSKITSGLTITGGVDGFGKVIRIRGVGTNSFVPAIRPAVGIFVNEVPLGDPAMAYNNMADIERVEVLKGPQATLFGKEVSSGAISMHTFKPHTEEIEGYVEGNFGNLGLMEYQGGINFPMGDSVALRVSGYYNERDDFIDNITVPNRPGGEYEQQGYRARLLWRPTDAVDIILSYEDHDTDTWGTVNIAAQYGDLYQSIDQARNPGNSLLNVLDPKDRKSDSSDPTYGDTTSSMTTLHVEWAINDEWSLASVTSDQEWEQTIDGEITEEGTADTSIGPYHLNDFWTNPTTDTTTQELRLTFDNGTWSSLLGAFYADTNTTSYTPFASTVLVVGGTPIGFAGLSDLDDDFEEWALYSHNIYSVTDRLDLTFGLRYSEVDKDGRKAQLNGVGPLAHLNQVAPVTPWADDIPEQSDTWDEFTGTLKVNYWVTQDISVYAGWDRGFKAGGHNVCKGGGEDPECPEPFDSETADNFEVGFKGKFFDQTLRWTGAVFYQTYDDYQVEIQDEIGLGNVVQNAASVEIQGVETDFQWLAGQHLTVDGNISYIDATWDEYEDAGCIRPQYQRVACQEVINDAGVVRFIQDLSGERLNYTPEWSGNLNATWSDTFSNGMQWYIRGETVYRDDRVFFPDLDPQTVDGSYALFNASFGLTAEDGSWDIILWGKNLADEDYLISANKNNDSTLFGPGASSAVMGYRVQTGQELTYGINLKYRFNR